MWKYENVAMWKYENVEICNLPACLPACPPEAQRRRVTRNLPARPKRSVGR